MQGEGGRALGFDVSGLECNLQDCRVCFPLQGSEVGWRDGGGGWVGAWPGITAMILRGRGGASVQASTWQGIHTDKSKQLYLQKFMRKKEILLHVPLCSSRKKPPRVEAGFPLIV